MPNRPLPSRARYHREKPCHAFARGASLQGIIDDSSNKTFDSLVASFKAKLLQRRRSSLLKKRTYQSVNEGLSRRVNSSKVDSDFFTAFERGLDKFLTHFPRLIFILSKRSANPLHV